MYFESLLNMHSIYSISWDKTQTLQKFPPEKIKLHSFFFFELQLIIVLYLTHVLTVAEAQGLSFKKYVRGFPFSSPSCLYSRLDFCLKSMDPLTLRAKATFNIVKGGWMFSWFTWNYEHFTKQSIQSITKKERIIKFNFIQIVFSRP